MRVGFIYTIAATNAEEVETIFWGIKKINATDYHAQSRLVRENIIEHFKKSRMQSDEYYSFAKTGTIPYLYVNELKNNVLVSFSHDSMFVAYAYRIPESVN